MCSARPGAAESITQLLTDGVRPRALVRTVAGLERLAAAELAAAGHRVIDLSRRQLVAEPDSAGIVAEPPRLVDDLFLIGADLADPGRTRADLAAFAPALGDRLTVPLPHVPGEALSVSASFTGRRTYSRFDIEDVVGAVLAERTGAAYHSRRAGAAPPPRRVDWRVVLDGDRARVAVRPFAVPLHRRDFRARAVVGSLHPPVAAAIARLARLEAGQRVVDPFCGAGTILLEAHRIEPRVRSLGIDRDPGAIAVARGNGPALGAGIAWRVGDSRCLGSLDGPVDRIVTNPPWGVRLGVGSLAPYARQWRRVLRPDGLVVAIVHRDQAPVLTDDPGWRVVDVHDVSVAGQHPRIVVAGPR